MGMGFLLTEECKADKDKHEVGEDVHVVLVEGELHLEYHIGQC